MGSDHAEDLGGAEGANAVDAGYAYLDFSGLAVWVSRGDTLAPPLQMSQSSLEINQAKPALFRGRGRLAPDFAGLFLLRNDAEFPKLH